MEQLFINVLNNAITVSVLIVAIIVVRALGKKMPKWSTCILWGIVAVKLVIPIPIESVLSVIPIGNPIPTNIVMEANPQISSGISSVDEIVNPVISRSFTPDPVASVNPLQIFFHIGALAWITGMIVMLTYALTTYMLVRKRVRASVKIAPRVYECDDISDSFILGTIAPKVYLSSELSEEAREYILKHEFAHLSRRDHIWKPLGFVILSVYWFNPLCWIAYILLCRDIEYACDEKVTKNIKKGEKAEYCRVLLENSMPRKMIAACPVTFGGIDVKNRVKNVVNYKKPAFWITTASIMACVAVGVCFATSREVKTVSEEQQLQKSEFENSVIASDGVVESEKKEDEAATSSNSIAIIDKENTSAGNLKDAEFTYNGNVISAMDDFETLDKALGGYDPDRSVEGFYAYGKEEKKDFDLQVLEKDGIELPIFIVTEKDVITTSRNIKVGSTREEVMEAYGEPNVEHPKAFGPDGKELTEDKFNEIFGESLIYDFGDCQITFAIREGKVTCITYQNNINHDKFTWS